MNLEHYGNKFGTHVSKPEDVISITNILKNEFHLEYQGEDIFIKSGDTKSFTAQKGFSIAKIIATTHCKKVLGIQPISKKYVEIFKEIIGMKSIEYGSLEIETLKQIASEKRIVLIDDNGKQKVKAKIIEELGQILNIESETEEKLKMINAKKSIASKEETADNKLAEAEEKAKVMEAKITELEANAKAAEEKVKEDAAAAIKEANTDEVKKSPKKKEEKTKEGF